MDKLLHRWGRKNKAISLGLQGVYLEDNSLIDAEDQSEQEYPRIQISQCNRTNQNQSSPQGESFQAQINRQLADIAINPHSEGALRNPEKTKENQKNRGSGLWKKLEETAQHARMTLLGDPRQGSRQHSVHSKSGSHRKSPMNLKSPGRTGMWRRQHRNRSKNHLTVF